MAERRMISKSISTSQKLSKVSLLGKLLFTWLIPHCDDYGQFYGDVDTIKWRILPRVNEAPEEEIEKCLVELIAVGLIDRFPQGTKVYLKVIGFETFQTFKNDRPRISILESNGIQRNPLDSLSKDKLSKDIGREEGLPAAGRLATSFVRSWEEPTIDAQTNEPFKEPDRELPKHGNVKNLITWAEERRKRTFSDHKSQIQALHKMGKAGIMASEVQDRWCEMEIDSYWKEKGFDYWNVLKSFDRKPL